MANILEDYNNYLTENGKYNSSAYNALTDNKIDQNELVGIEKDPDAEDVKLTYDDDKVKEQEGYDWSKGFADFAKDIVPSSIYSVSNGLINVMDVGVNLAPLGFKMIDAITPGDLSEPQQNFQQKMKNVSDFLAKPRDKNNERLEANSGAANFVSMVFQDLPAAVPIYRKLKSIGVPNIYALPISAGIGGSITYEDEMSLGLNTETIKEFKNYIGLIEETPEEELFDVTYKAFTGTGLAFAIPGIWKAAKFVKKNIPKFGSLAKEAATATAAGGVLGKSVYDTLNPNEQSNFSEEKKTPELGDQSSNQSMMQEFYGLDKTQLEKISEATGFPVDELQSAGLQKIFTNPKLLQKAKEVITPIFKSKVVEAVKNIPNKGSGNQVLGQIKNIPGVKQSEIKWIGLDDFLKNKKTVTKKEVSDFVNQNRIDVNETLRGGEFGERAKRFSNEIENMVTTFENKWIARGPDAGVPIYDTYNLVSRVVDGTKMNKRMDFAQIRNSNIGKFIAARKNISDIAEFKNKKGNFEFYVFEKPDATTKVVTKNKIKDADLLARDYRQTGKFEFEPLEVEKYLVEDAKRAFRSKNINKPKFEQQYTEPGGKDYTELVFSLKDRKRYPAEMLINQPEVIANPQFKLKSAIDWTSPTAHFGKKNEIAHVRFKTRDLNGMKVLTVEEMQNDLLQAIQRGDVKGSAGDKITDFPFKNTWYELTVKRLIRYAADNGFDAVAIPKGKLAAKRYGQNFNKTKKIMFSKNRDQIYVSYLDGDGVAVESIAYAINQPLSYERALTSLKKDVGEKAYNKIIRTNKSGNSYINLDKPIVIGEGKGKYELYDKAIPGFMKKYGKKWNAKVYDDKIPTLTEKDYSSAIAAGQEVIVPEGFPVTILELTPEMKKAVQEGGQPLFEILGTLGASGVAAKAVSDSKGNNTISNQTNY